MPVTCARSGPGCCLDPQAKAVEPGIWAFVAPGMLCRFESDAGLDDEGGT
jgi:hypothetical protein